MSTHEAVILVRVDNMTPGAERAEAQLAIRFPADMGAVDEDSLSATIAAMVQAALDQAPPVAEWTASGFPRR